MVEERRDTVMSPCWSRKKAHGRPGVIFINNVHDMFVRAALLSVALVTSDVQHVTQRE